MRALEDDELRSILRSQHTHTQSQAMFVSSRRVAHIQFEHFCSLQEYCRFNSKIVYDETNEIINDY